MFFSWEVDIGFHLSLVIEKLEGFVINIQKSVLVSADNWGINHISRVIGAFINLGSEDVSSLKDDLS